MQREDSDLDSDPLLTNALLELSEVHEAQVLVTQVQAPQFLAKMHICSECHELVREVMKCGEFIKYCRKCAMEITNKMIASVLTTWYVYPESVNVNVKEKLVKINWKSLFVCKEVLSKET